jgi:uncharacterized protein YndB with AHSA1/START domain
MTVTAIRKDPQSRTMTLEAEFDASPERVWQLWADPRQLERWWGPPTYPATVDAHDLRPGGQVEYHMTGPEGDQPRGFWDVDEVEAPHRLVFRDGFANEDGTPNTELPTTTARVTIRELGGGKSRMSIESDFRPSGPWSNSPPWAWRRGSPRPSPRLTRSWPRSRSRVVDAGDGRREFRHHPNDDQTNGKGTATMKLTTTTQVSVDGVMQGPGGPDENRGGGFERGGWAMPHFDNEAMTVMDEIYQRADAFLFGGRTYEIFAGS